MKKIILAATAAGVLLSAASAYAAPIPSNATGMSAGDQGIHQVKMMKKKKKMMMKKKMM